MRRHTLILFLALGVSAPALAHKPTVTTFTYHKDIYPIFASKCGSCHQTGGVAPMSLLTYREAFPWAVSIKNEVLHLAMPPWFADDRYGLFKHEGGLSAEEMDTIVDWCLGGSPEGDASDRVELAETSSEALGEPDMVLEMPMAVLLDAGTSESVEEVVIQTAHGTDAFIRAIGFLPGAKNVVRGMTVAIEGADVPMASWVPGQPVAVAPAGRGHRLPSGATLTLRIHYKKTWLDDGSPVEDQSALALYLEETAKAIETVAVSAGATHDVDVDTELLALLPRLDASAESLEAALVRADGSREPILRLYQPSAEWPRKYWLQQPLLLPAGSHIEVRALSPGDGAPAILLDLASE